MPEPQPQENPKVQKWESAISDPEERKVFEALSDRNWDFRTLEGMEISTGIPGPAIKSILSKHRKFIRRSIIPDAKGRELYTLRSRRVKGRELLGWARALISKSVG